MKPIKTEAVNLSLTAPAGWDAATHGPCETLHVHRDGTSLSSYWKPTPDDIIAMMRGASVKLTVMATGHPPVVLQVDPDNLKEVK